MTKAMSFPAPVSVATAQWNKYDLVAIERPWYPGAVKLINEVPLSNNEWLVGVEVEAENLAHAYTNEKMQEVPYPIWNTKPDNSLRNNGLEFVSIPMKGPMVHKAMAYLSYCLGNKVDFSSRCSVHVHLNVRDMTVSQVVALGLVYAAAERLLFRWVGHSRETNIFCVPVYMTHDLQGLFSAAMVKFHKPVSFKYSALNFNTTCINSGLPLYGTVEFRHLFGTANGETVVRWINLIFAMKRYAMKHPLDGVLASITELNTTSSYGLWLKSVFGPLYDDLALGIKGLADFQSMMEASISEVKRCAFNNNFHQQLHAGYPAASSPFTKALRKKYGAFTVQSSKKPSDGLSEPAVVPSQFVPVGTELFVDYSVIPGFNPPPLPNWEELGDPPYEEEHP